MTKPKPRCPECNKIFETVQLVAMHRKKAHNVEGTSKAHLAAQALKARKEAAAAHAAMVAPTIATNTEPLPVTFPCPECGAGFASPQLLGRHRKQEHGVQTVGEAKRQARLAMQDGLPCPHCDFIAANKAGFSLHVNKQHPDQPKPEGVTLEQPTQTTRAIIRTNGNGQAAAAQPEGQAHSDGIPEATLALALGRFQGFCTSMATEFDLPPRRFARELSRLIYASQVR
jgi:uncharacterized C2H2 Zn-finger protein